MKGPCCCAKEEFRLTFWQSIRYLYLLLVNFNSNLKGLKILRVELLCVPFLSLLAFVSAFCVCPFGETQLFYILHIF